MDYLLTLPAPASWPSFTFKLSCTHRRRKKSPQFIKKCTVRPNKKLSEFRKNKALYNDNFRNLHKARIFTTFFFKKKGICSSHVEIYFLISEDPWKHPKNVRHLVFSSHAEKQTRPTNKKKASTYIQCTYQIKHKIKIQLTADVLVLAWGNI